MHSIYYDDYRHFDISELICDKNLIIMFKSKSDDASKMFTYIRFLGMSTLGIREYTLEKYTNERICIKII